MDAASSATHAADVFLSIGTSAVVYPAAQLPLTAREAGAYVAEINPDRTPLSDDVDAFLQEEAGTALPALIQALNEANGG
jgi:NAD-dependent deacetylase